MISSPLAGGAVRYNTSGKWAAVSFQLIDAFATPGVIAEFCCIGDGEMETIRIILRRIFAPIFAVLVAAIAANSAVFAQDCSNPLHCFAENKFDAAVNGAWLAAQERANIRGREFFGPHFSIVGDMSYSAAEKLGGNLDVVIPFSDSGDLPPESAFFFQSGVTRWKDSHNFSRDDFRQGIAYRAIIGNSEKADVAGFWAFVQHNRQRGHARFAFGSDYETPYGAARFSYFVPLTDWRTGRAGYEERALEGGDITAEFDMWRRISFNIGAGRWERKDSGGRFDSYLQAGLRLQVLPILSTDVAWRGQKRGLQLNALLDIPLDGKKRGYASPRHSSPAAANLYRAIATPRRLEVAERRATPKAISGATVRFMQDNANSGAQIMLEVILPEVVLEDSDFVVQLVPGGGHNPAVPGLDFDDSPILLTMKRGEKRGTAIAKLLFNEQQTQTRTLAAKVYPAN